MERKEKLARAALARELARILRLICGDRWEDVYDDIILDYFQGDYYDADLETEDDGDPFPEEKF